MDEKAEIPDDDNTSNVVGKLHILTPAISIIFLGSLLC